MKKSFLLIILALLFITACAQGGTDESMAADTGGARGPMPAAAPAEDMEMAEEAMEQAAYDADDGFTTGSNNSAQVDFPETRMIIRNGELSLIVSDTEEAMRRIGEMAEANGGWVVNSNLFQYDEEAKSGSITVRVPSSGFNSALEAMKELAVEVEAESTSGQDVTDEYVDLSLQLDNLEATADRVRSFLEETRNVEEALAVNQELSRLEGEIERIKGRMEYLSQSASFSTITVNLRPDVLAQPIEVGGWQPQGIVREAIEALVDALQGTASFLIWVGVYLLPLLLLYGIPLYIVFRLARAGWRRLRRRGDEPTPQTD